jgi:TPR repeat protein
MRLMMLLAAASAALAAPPAAATVKAGVEAWQKGEHERAVAIWRALAAKGDADAAFNLGQAYRLGRGVAADSASAGRWFEAAARSGHLDAQVSLGLLLFDSGDRKRALDWLMKAAERGEPRALLVTGIALFNGDELPRDVVKGYAFVSRAAAQGLEPARTTLADMDKVLPLDERRKGVAMALAAAKAPKPAPRPVKAAPAPAPAAPALTARAVASARGVWRIQLGAFSSRASAQALYARLQGRLGGAQAYYVPVGAMTRLQAGPFDSRASASAVCTRLKPQPCFALEAR